MFYLICYDVVNDRRNRVSRLLEGYGLRVQKSVFECVLTPDQYGLLQRRFQTKRYLRSCTSLNKGLPKSSKSVRKGVENRIGRL